MTDTLDSLPLQATAVRVTNIGDSVLRGPVMVYDRVEYRIEPGESKVMPYIAACMFFGDPRAINIGDPDQNRATQHRRHECERLSVLWGTYDTEWYSEVPITTPGGDDELHMDSKKRSTGLVPYIAHRDLFMHPNLPRVEVVLADTGEKLTTVIEDPVGEGLAPPDTSKLELQTLQTQYDALKQRLDSIAGQIQHTGPEFDPLDNIEVEEKELGVDGGGDVGLDGNEGARVIDELVDPDVKDAPATSDTPASRARKKPVRKTNQ